MAFLEFVYLLGLDLGVGVSGPIYELAGFSPIYVLSAIVVCAQNKQFFRNNYVTCQNSAHSIHILLEGRKKKM